MQFIEPVSNKEVAFFLEQQGKKKILNFPYLPTQDAEKLLHERCQELDAELRFGTFKSSINPALKAKNTIAFLANKGGVGKSSLCYAAALGLSQVGYKVGIFDADIFGPCQHLLTDTSGELQTIDNTIYPALHRNIQVVSMGHLTDQSTPLMLRGPLASRYAKEMLLNSYWDNLDFLLCDFPPGTTDIHLTLLDKDLISGAVLVTTPHPLSLATSSKMPEFLHKVELDIFGYILNMSYTECPQCKHKELVKQDKEQAEWLKKYKLLGEIPLKPQFDWHTHTWTQDIVRNLSFSIYQKNYQRKENIIASS